MIDSSDDSDAFVRCRRVRQCAGKSYDGIGKRTLELRDVLDMLSCYRDYEGGINCNTCGKLYKSKVCFIKHIWEHSVYWEQFAGERNHERVLGIQAALILYSGYSENMAERLMELLVTSPTDNTVTTPARKASSKKTSALRRASNTEVTPKKLCSKLGEPAKDEDTPCLSYPGSAAMWQKSISSCGNKVLEKDSARLPDTCQNNLRTPLTPKKYNQPTVGVEACMKVRKLDFNARYPTTPAKRIPHPLTPVTPRKQPRLQ